MKAQILVGADPGSVSSYREHFFANRRRFFTVGLLGVLASAVNPLIQRGSVEVFIELLPFSLPGIGIHVLGLVARSPRVHGVLCVLALLLAAAVLFLIPNWVPTG